MQVIITKKNNTSQIKIKLKDKVTTRVHNSSKSKR